MAEASPLIPPDHLELHPVRSKNSNRAIHKDLQEKQKVARGVEP
jgi:hypothetical protein